ncbi:GGDEF domain-containing protein [Alteromonadaceae bacterium M269]|nr:GGDEF domain-containing protein [Alteromonadaceae bacterium M269]
MSNYLSALKKALLAYEFRALVDFLILLVACVLVFSYVSSNDVAERFHEFAQGYELFELDEIPIALSACLIFVLIFTFRRLQDLKSQIVLANMDSLVEIYNRRKGEELLKARVKSSNLHNIPLSVIMIDVDDFKAINDQYGHDAGDLVLKDVIKLVQEKIRKGDILIRWGGEEFLIVCPKLDKEVAIQLANRIRIAIMEHRFSVAGKVTASFGVAEYKLCESVMSFVARADALLYESKGEGKNCVSSS